MGPLSITSPGRFKAAQFGSGTLAASIIGLSFFGPALDVIRATFSASSAMMVRPVVAWPSLGEVNGWTAPADNRTVILKPVTTSDVAVVLQVGNVSDGTMAVLSTSLDGRVCYEAGVVLESGTYYAVIRRVIEGSIVDEGTSNFAVPQTAGDLPATGFARVALSGITSGEPARIEARWVQGRIELAVNGGEVVVRHRVPTSYSPAANTDTFAPGTYGPLKPIRMAGFATRLTGARVVSVQLFDLEGQRSERADVVVVLGGGDVHQSIGADLVPSSLNVFDPGDTVASRDFNGLVLMVGGGKARAWSPVTGLATPWIPTAGTLPGQTDPGTTTATGIGQHGTRVVLFGVPGDENNLYESATSNHLDWAIDPNRFGSAFTLAGFRPLKAGQPIRCVAESAVGALVVGCTGSIQLVTGDPVLGNFDTREIHATAGVLGPRSMVRLGEGRLLIHTPMGMMLQAGLGEPVGISRTVLTEIVERTPAGASIVTAHDSLLGWNMLWIVPEAGAGLHLLQDQRVADWAQGLGGFFPFSVPEGMQPVASAMLNGRAIFACADGYVRRFELEAVTDDGEPIKGYADCKVMDPPKAATELELSRVEVELTPDSGPVTWTAWGGASSAAAYDRKLRKALAASTVTYSSWGPWAGNCRAAAMVVSLRATAPATVESVWVDATGRDGSSYGCRPKA